jgi:hypothetical protein
MSLQHDSSDLRKNLEAEIGDKIKLLDRETEALLQSGIIKNSLQVGQKAPDFSRAFRRMQCDHKPMMSRMP